MNVYISILRGINVGGNNQIKMDALRQMYTTLGFTDILSYIQSGNVIFRAEESNIKSLERMIANKIIETFGCKVPVLVLTIGELKEALINNPFLADETKDMAFMHLTFLSEIPDKMLYHKIQHETYLPDEFGFSNKIIYLYCPTGYGKTKLTNTFFENKLKVTATTRNLKTSTELLVLAEKL
ncbi:MAG: DUF1697 domain-containing protein [Paludibacter sp.]|nr:DUF1697 domain-containing protein [Paludibacter sp.]